MKKMGLFIIGLLLGAKLSFALSFPQVLERCTEDSLAPAEARLRNAWARKCFPQLRSVIDFHDAQTPNSYLLGRNDLTNSWRAPLDANAPCDGWKTIAFCVASCYPADQRLFFSNGIFPIKTAVDLLLPNIVTLSQDAALDALSYQTLPVREYTRSFQEGNELILNLVMKSGKRLAVTEGHPMLLATGVMTTARLLKTGEHLIRYDHQTDEIIAIVEEQFWGRVYNVAPRSGHPLENIVIAEGYLTGSGAYQYLEQFSSLIGRQLMRKTIEL